MIAGAPGAARYDRNLGRYMNVMYRLYRAWICHLYTYVSVAWGDPLSVSGLNPIFKLPCVRLHLHLRPFPSYVLVPTPVSALTIQHTLRDPLPSLEPD